MDDIGRTQLNVLIPLTMYNIRQTGLEYDLNLIGCGAVWSESLRDTGYLIRCQWIFWSRNYFRVFLKLVWLQSHFETVSRRLCHFLLLSCRVGRVLGSSRLRGSVSTVADTYQDWFLFAKERI